MSLIAGTQLLMLMLTLRLMMMLMMPWPTSHMGQYSCFAAQPISGALRISSSGGTEAAYAKPASTARGVHSGHSRGTCSKATEGLLLQASATT